MTRTFALLVAALCWCHIAGADPAPQDPPPVSEIADGREIREIRVRLDEQQRQLAEQQRQLALQAAEIDRLRSVQDATRSLPLLFRTGGLAVQLSGFLQADVVAYHAASVDELNPASGEPLNETRFLLSRARLRLDVEYRWISGSLEIDGNTVHGATVRILNGDVSARWAAPGAEVPYLMASIGLLRIPFGWEVQERDFVRLFLERSNVIRAFFPGEFDLGARLQGGWRFFRYQIAAMNGQPVGARQFAARDPTRSKDLVGRLGVEARFTPRCTLAIGLSGLYGQGFHSGTPATKNTLVWSDANFDGQVEPTELVGVAGLPATPSRSFSRYAFGGDLRLAAELPRLGELVIYGEALVARNRDRGLAMADPVSAGRALRELGWYLGVTQALTRWAAIGVRYDQYNPDLDSTDRSGARIVPRDKRYTTLAIAVAAVYAPYARLVVEYDRHTNALGRAASGAPATLGANVLTIRAQVTY